MARFRGTPYQEDDWVSSDKTLEYDEYLNAEEKSSSYRPSGIQEQLYAEKLGILKSQMEALDKGVLPEYLKRTEQLRTLRDERLAHSELVYKFVADEIEWDCEQEKRKARVEFEAKEEELRLHLLADLQEKKKQLEIEKNTWDILGDLPEAKVASTRQLRRRAHPEASDTGNANGDKRRKVGLNGRPLLNWQAADEEISSDVALIKSFLPDEEDEDDAVDESEQSSSRHLRGTGNYSSSRSAVGGGGSSGVGSGSSSSSSSSTNPHGSSSHRSRHSQADTARIEDGKLFLGRRWFHRGQSVSVVDGDGRGMGGGVITAIHSDHILIKRDGDSAPRLRLSLSNLQRGRYQLKRGYC
ncbi:unnamed protein product [Cyprideis torosa]|uniref:Uncharacterized protein n=1 Tax=Cyprideis torosa TaxID=163714 RepID=A0A7R8W8X2_9CRUS|nr:unnamed protein product [Cyprideis torosa]CAG0884767.1 unnamed protein product [Cyprideis torosa]